MNDVERWIDLEGPEPPGIHDLLESVREVPESTPEEDAALARSIHAAIAARRRRDRLVRGATAGSILALAAAAAIGFWHFAPRSAADAEFVRPNALAKGPPRPPTPPGNTSSPSASPSARASEGGPGPTAAPSASSP
jgi:hypothetical protein